MTIYTPREHTVEVEEFLGTPVSAELLGLFEARYTERGADRPAWNTVDEVGPFWTLDGRTPVLPGDVFERQAAIDEGPARRQAGPWKYVGETRTPEGRAALARAYVRVVQQWVARSVPEGPMTTENGFRMFDEQGGLLRRPAIGEQDLDRTTGEPMVDEQGQPILVTE